MPRKTRGVFFELDPEIEQTLRWRRKIQKDLLKTIQMLHQEENPNPSPPHSDDEENYSDEEETYQEQDIIQLANSKDGGIMDYAIPVLGQLHSGILKPKIKAANFALKPLMFSMLQTNGQFSGTAVEDPHSHLKAFMQISDSFRIPGVSTNALRLSLFPFSLK